MAVNRVNCTSSFSPPYASFPQTLVIISEDRYHKAEKLLLVVQYKKPAMSELSGLLLCEKKDKEVSFRPHRA